MAKILKPTPTIKQDTAKNKKDDFQRQADKILTEIKKLSSLATKKYKSLDNNTKKKLAIGVGLLAALTASSLWLKKNKNKNK